MVVIRLARAGTKKKPFYHVVAAENRGPRDGKYLARLGTYNPKAPVEKSLVCDFDQVDKWIANGARPSETVGQIFARARKSN